MPSLYILTGPNGAGKSTTGPSLLPDIISKKYTAFDGDKLKMLKQVEFRQKRISYKEAGRLADEYVYSEFERLYREALSQKDHFVYEGHFSEESSWNLIRDFKEAGYKIDMIFIGLVSIELSKDRVFHRAKKGGHNVQLYDIERNYFGNLQKLNEHIELIDQLTLLDNSKRTPIFIGQWRNDNMDFHVEYGAIPDWVKIHLPHLYAKGNFAKKTPSIKTSLKSKRAGRKK